jgi:predicted ATPase
VLDNCEHLLEASRVLVAELRGAGSRLVILATSREPLGLDGEYLYAVPPLASPPLAESPDPATLLRHPAVALFVDRARLVAPDFALDTTTAPAVKEICRAVEGLPLAIELAAARVRVLTVQEIAARLDHLLALLRGQPGAFPRRHATLLATLNWSTETLGASERRGFRMLAVFAGGWDLEGAGAVLELDEIGALDLVDALVNHSLVIVEARPSGTRYRYLEPVRQFAAELLTNSGEAAEARGRFVDHMVALAETSGDALLGPQQSEWLARIGLEHENVQAAIGACGHLPNGAESALRIAGSLWRYWHIRGHLRGGAESVRRALTLPGAQATSLHRARALYAAGALAAFDMEGQRRADEFFEESLATFRAVGDEVGVARCLTGLGAAASARREFAAGAAYLEEAQESFRRLGDRRGLAVTLNNLGAAAWNQGDLERARTSIYEALDLARAGGDLGNVGLLSVALAMIHARLGEPAAARTHLRECLKVLGALGARHSSAAGALLAVGELASLEGRHREVARWLGAADSVLESLGLVLDASDVWWQARPRCWDAARGALGEEAAAAAYRSGRALNCDEALKQGLESLARHSPRHA